MGGSLRRREQQESNGGGDVQPELWGAELSWTLQRSEISEASGTGLERTGGELGLHGWWSSHPEPVLNGLCNVFVLTRRDQMD